MRTFFAMALLLVAPTDPTACGQATGDSPAANPANPAIASASPYLATAANGMGIPHPTAKTTFSIDDRGRAIEVPEGMVYVPAGECQIGAGRSATTENVAGFCIGRFSVTNAEYNAFLDANKSERAPRYWSGATYPAGKANHPVAFVSLVQARAYAAWVGQETGRNVAIPTSVQWEKAARGPKGTVYPWGDKPETSYEGGVLTTKFNYNAVMVAPLLDREPKREVTYSDRKGKYFGTKTTVDEIAAIDADEHSTKLSISPTGSVRAWNSHATATGFTGTDLFKAVNAAGGNTTPVGTYEAGKSGYGAYDMAGNIWNFTETQIVATNGVEKGKTVNEIRGGSWYSNIRSCRATTIGEGRDAAGHYNTVGFRIVMNPDPKP